MSHLAHRLLPNLWVRDNRPDLARGVWVNPMGLGCRSWTGDAPVLLRIPREHAEPPREPGPRRGIAAVKALSAKHDAAFRAFLDDDLKKKLSDRDAGRRRKDFKESDRIRDELKARGIVITDTPQGIRWHPEVG